MHEAVIAAGEKESGITIHWVNENYDEVLKIARHCQEHLTLLRYFDLQEVVTFITLVTR